MKREAIRKAFEVEFDTHPLVLHYILLRSFGSEYVDWEMSTVNAEIRLTFKSTANLSVYNKIQAVRTALVNPEVYTAWQVFTPIAVSFSGDSPVFNSAIVPTPIECGVAALILKGLNPRLSLSNEVAKAIAACLVYEGLSYCEGMGSGVDKKVNHYIQKLLPDSTLQQKVKVAVPKVLVRSNKPVANDDVSVQAYKTAKLKQALASDVASVSSQMKMLGLSLG